MLGKNLGAECCAPKSGNRSEKCSVLSPEYVHKTNLHYRNLSIFSFMFLYIIFFHIFRMYYFLRFSCFFFSVAIILLWCVSVNISHMFLVYFLLIVTIIIYQQVLLFFVFILILTKMVTAFNVIITTFWMIYGYFL